jgi:hypothetical protein
MFRKTKKIKIGDIYDGDWIVTWISDGWITITNYKTGQEKEIER